MAKTFKPYDIGLAFSGGGSRAAAFHRGTLRGLYETGLLSQEIIGGNKVVVSTVSGGSVFGASWLASIANDTGVDDFLVHLKLVLQKGFVGLRSLPGLLKAAVLPGYTRTNELAKTFDQFFFKQMKLKDLPEKPRLCINSTVLNNGQVGKFSRLGFSVSGVKAESVADFPLCLAVAASAAFPIGLPPIFLKKGKHIPEDWGKNSRLKNHKCIALTDGGVLENLGIQTMLVGRTFKAWNIVMSDAGAMLKTWKPGNPLERLMGFGMGLVSASILKRITTLMNDKENRHMRFQLFRDMEQTWLIDNLRKGNGDSSFEIKKFIEQQPEFPRRKVLFIRIAQTWNRFLSNISDWRLRELGHMFKNKTGKEPPSIPVKPQFYEHDKLKLYPGLVEKYLEQILDESRLENCKKAKAIWLELEKTYPANDIQKIKTNFTKLSADKCDALHNHAYWQVLISHALFW